MAPVTAIILTIYAALLCGVQSFGDYGYYSYYYYDPVGQGAGGYSPPAYYPPAYYPPPAYPPAYPPTYSGQGTCPPCKSCKTAASLAATSKSTDNVQSKPGQCYCPYDADWQTWALDDTQCQAALKQKCQTDDRISCEWVDAYSSPSTSAASSRPYSKELSEYLYNDCEPAPPCACATLSFTESDSAADVLKCCQELNVYAAMPYATLKKKTTSNYCSKGTDREAIQKWVVHTLWHADCSSSSTGVYNYTASESTSKAAQSTRDVSVQAKKDSKSNTVAVAAAAAGVGGAALGGLAAVAVITWWAKTRTPVNYATLPGPSTV